MKEMTWLTYLMFILASYRLTHLIVFDKITEFIRKPFVKKINVETESGTKTKEVPKSLFGYLLKCYWCAGVWSAVSLAIFYFLFPRAAIVVIFILSIAGGQSILETFVGVNLKKVDFYAEIEKKK